MPDVIWGQRSGDGNRKEVADVQRWMRTVRCLAGGAAIALMCFVVITAGGRPASACTCGVLSDVEALALADAAFTGTLVSIEELLLVH